MDLNHVSIVRPTGVQSDWSLRDYLGALGVRFSIGRNRYRVRPGLYSLGHPGKESDVFVTANYKLSYDLLRKHLGGRDSWILVLDTHGINVWCAAGKGTFGSDELLRQIKNSGLASHVSHRRLIVPQLGAPGISAQQVKAASGFTVKFGPVRAADIASYLASGYRKDEAARTVAFGLKDRFILTGVELANSLAYLFGTLVFLALLSGFHSGGYSLEKAWTEGRTVFAYIGAAYLSGTFLTPLLLPLLPFRQFAGKGLVMGGLVYGLITLTFFRDTGNLAMVAWFLMSGAISSYLAMNFTGASTFTSLSGVRKEMRLFVPVQILFALTGLLMLVISKLQ